MILGLLQTYCGEKYIHKTLDSLSCICDEIFAINSGSSSVTQTLLERCPKVVNIIKTPKFEGPWTQHTDYELRTLALRYADLVKPEYCISLDDDEEFDSSEDVRNTLLRYSPEYVWYPVAHLMDRKDLARTTALGSNAPSGVIRAWKWRIGDTILSKDLHCGSYPQRLRTSPTPPLRSIVWLIHWGYFTEEDRRRKVEEYKKIDPSGRLSSGVPPEKLLSPTTVVPFVWRESGG